MKNVLVIAYLLRASPRISGLVKYLPEFGYNPIILTGKSRGTKFDFPCKIVATNIRDTFYRLNPDSDIRDSIVKTLGESKLVSILLCIGGEILNYPCPDKYWKPYALSMARSIIISNNIHAMISSSAPVIAHIIAQQLKREYGLRWVADLRDLWSQNHNYHYSPIRRYLDRRIEVKTLKDADYITAISEPWLGELGKLHKRPIRIITHGYDTDCYSETAVSKAFTIVYAGKVYDKQCSNLFFEGLEKSRLGKSIGVYMYGSNDKSKHPQYENVYWEKHIEHSEMIKKEQEAQVLLAFGWQSSDEPASGLYGGKIFEYLGAKRPIMICGYPIDNAVKKLIQETNSGVYCSSPGEVARQLLEWYREYRNNGYVKYCGVDSVVSQYTHKAMASKFAELLG